MVVAIRILILLLLLLGISRHHDLHQHHYIIFIHKGSHLNAQAPESNGPVPSLGPDMEDTGFWALPDKL